MVFILGVFWVEIICSRGSITKIVLSEAGRNITPSTCSSVGLELVEMTSRLVYRHLSEALADGVPMIEVYKPRTPTSSLGASDPTKLT